MYRFWDDKGEEMLFDEGQADALWEKLSKILAANCDYCGEPLTLTGFERTLTGLVVDWKCKHCGNDNHGEYSRAADSDAIMSGKMEEDVN